MPEQFNNEGRISYNRNILTSIVALAAQEIEGVANVYNKKGKNKNKAGVKIDFNDDGVFIDVFIKMLSGYNVPDVAFKIQENVKRGVETMTEYKVKNVNITVVGVAFSDDEEEIDDGEA